MIGWLRNLAGRIARSGQDRTATKPEEPVRWTLRRWEAAETDRLNSAHWQAATGVGINQDLEADMESLRTRSIYEAANNPQVEGVIESHTIDLVGTDGPTLQVTSSRETYNSKLEKAVQKWWASPDINGQLSMAEIIRLWVRQLWTCGELLSQIVTHDESPITAKVGLQVLDPRRLITPYSQAGDPAVTLGVRRTRRGKPTQYYISQPTMVGSFELETGDAVPVPADLILHGFKTVEAGQVRGFPWLASSLPAIADLRDYDAQVLDAARQAADQAVFLYTDHPESNYLQVNEQTDFERRTVTTMPPGWKPYGFQPTQPSTLYIDYRNERLRDLGRPVNMPLMMVRLDSSKHNYSSARYDGQLYLRGLAAIQAWVSVRFLNRLVNEIARELELAGELPRRPADVKYVWIWPKQPHVDPKKEADAETARLANGTLTYQDACAANNQDWQTVIEQRRVANEALKKAGLPPLPVPIGSPQDSDPDDDGWNNAESNAENQAGKPAGKSSAKQVKQEQV